MAALMDPAGKDPLPLFDPLEQFRPEGSEEACRLMTLNAAFLIKLAGEAHPSYRDASAYIEIIGRSPDLKKTASFYVWGFDLIQREMESLKEREADKLFRLAEFLSKKTGFSREELAEHLWTVFFPEAAGTIGNEDRAVAELRAERSVRIEKLNPAPLTNPLKQVLFTSNVLLGLPSSSIPINDPNRDDVFKNELRRIAGEKQLYWYDHPVQIGVEPEKNEVLYGLAALDRAVDFEKQHDSALDGKLSCVLSVSVTHEGLHRIAKSYLRRELEQLCRLKNLEVFAFCEKDVRRLVEEVLAPAAKRFRGVADAGDRLAVFGVDGPYGRHYSFLKAILALWNTLIDPAKTATFKIDLDQVFDQDRLLKETGLSAFGHLTTPLWGARAVDGRGIPLEMGMIAGALVNHDDIERSVFTPDVPVPGYPVDSDGFFFYSKLPQGISTKAEMMTRYSCGEPDGVHSALQRIHVTGGTNGILLKSLNKHRPFTPSFIGRAEDQAYILSVLNRQEPRLAYVHKDGLIMRHDKYSFAKDAVKSAFVGKLVGDYVRILYFSAYSAILAETIDEIKDVIDPFTGSFVSHMPATVVYLRYALRAAAFFGAGETQHGIDFINSGASRLLDSLKFLGSEQSGLAECYERERSGWNLYYDTVRSLGMALRQRDPFALELKERAGKIIAGCGIYGS